MRSALRWQLPTSVTVHAPHSNAQGLRIFARLPCWNRRQICSSMQRRDGSLGILEAGPNDTTRCRILPLLPHLNEYADKGPVWIRKRKRPLTAEQNACLTDFAERQDGKMFALVRLAGLMTPLRSRGPLRTFVIGKPNGDRFSYYCAELVVESC